MFEFSNIKEIFLLQARVDDALRSNQIMKGWFDAFRCDGGPTLYSFNNRTPVTGDVTIITYLVLFGTLYLAFLVIFPGIRKEVCINEIH